MNKQRNIQAIMRLFLLVILMPMMFSRPGWAWNALGHRLVAQVAIDQLDKSTIKKLNELNHAMDVVYRPMTLVNAAIWLDIIKSYDMGWYSTFHYVDLYFSNDGSPLPDTSKPNALKAIDIGLKLLNNSRATNFDKAFALRILLHVVGDLHQPMHTVSQVSEEHPTGDMGGNLYLLGNNSVAKNLHAYWDRGGGYLSPAYPLTELKVRKMAMALEKKWPCSLSSVNTDPIVWVKESHQLAMECAYSVPFKSIPSKAYQKRVKEETMKRIATGGCRLAKLLKDL